ncbi:flagellar hook-associated protein FlgK [Sinomonas susongensis]|uniref:flagellar hook-associated protein FlgK n=1 Tax=Sinomonas susongensis TaxID=1324851 RepID=UPI0011098054|nr:flagellar hook-associated protein FlgK [Sinomonas susongensis]
MSTFGALNAAYRGLSAAQQAIDVAGQNIDNVGTDGYTRQRLEQSAMGPLARTMGSAAVSQVGQGVSVDSIARLGNALLDASVRSTSSSAGYAAQRSTAYQAIETTLQEPGANGISAQLQSFWSSWQDLANQPNDASAAATVVQNGKQLAAELSSGYSALAAQWSSTQSEAQGMVTSLNDAAAQVAKLNTSIRSTLAAGGNANELIDQRSKLTETIASLAGGSVRQQSDGTVAVFLGGNALVTGGTSRAVQLTGPQSLADTSSGAPTLVWADRPSVPVGLDGGTVAGDLSVLAPANASGTGGPIAEAAAQYNEFTVSLAQAVNSVHSQGKTPSGATGLDFFAINPSLPAAQGLSVVPGDASGIASGALSTGTNDGSNADAVAQLSTQAGSPDSKWAAFVSRVGSSSQTAQQQETMTATAATTAKTAQTSGASVSLDEENVNLLAGQHAYQAAARVLTALDQTLDTLINHMGTVGL